MLLRLLVCCVFCALTLLFVVSSYQPFTVQAGFQPPDPAELKMTSEPLAPGAPAIILYRQVDRDDNGRTSHEDNYVRIKILTEEGRKYANVELPFLKETANIVNIHARTIKPDGAIVNFEGKVFEATVAKERGSRYFAKTFTLPDVEIGSLIEYFYTVDLSERYIFDSHWILSEELFTKNARFSLKPYSGQSSSPIMLRLSWQGLPGTAAPKQGPDKIIRMDTANIPAFREEEFMPPENELKSRVDFIYEQASPGQDPDNFWKNFSKRNNGLIESFVGKHKSMEEAVTQIVSPNDPPEVKLHKIYDRVQKIRNTTYEVQKTQQEVKRDNEKLAQNVEEVWKRGYGEGPQLTWLFLGLARAAGFEAYVCFVPDRYQYFFNPKTMESRKLDATVVLVKLNGKELYFDPGAEFTPYGMLTWSETGVTGLRLGKDGGSWIKTTLPESSDSRIDRKAKFKLTDSGDLEGKLTVTCTGLEALYQRVEERHADDAARKKFLEDQIKNQAPVALEVELTNKPDWDGSETPLVAEYDVKIPGWASGAGKRAMMPTAIFTEGEKHMFEHAERVQPIYFEYPYEKDEDVTIELPAGWKVDSVPPAQSKDGHVVAYSTRAENGADSLHLTRKLTVNILLMEAKYYPALRNFFEAVRTGDEQQIVLLPGTSNASN